VGDERGNENDVRAFTKQWQKLLYKKERATEVCRKEAVEIFYVLIAAAPIPFPHFPAIRYSRKASPSDHIAAPSKTTSFSRTGARQS
jgi:hypothetical protein